MTWPEVPIGKVCELINGRAFKPEDWSAEGLPIVRIQNLNNESAPFNKYNGEVNKRFLIDSGALLFSWSGTPGTSFGAFFWNRGPAILNQHIFHVLVRPGVHAAFLRYALNGRINRIIAQAHGGVGLQHITKDKLETTTIPLPPLVEQTRITEILDKANAIRRKRKEALALTEELLRATFLEMFGDPVTNPKGWPTNDLTNIAQVQGGLQVTRSRDNNPRRLPYLRVANVHRNRLDLAEIKEIRVTETEYERCQLKAGDLLIVEGHGNAEELGRAAVWDGSISPITHQNHLIRVRTSADHMLPAFLSAFLNSSEGRRQLLAFAKTTSGLNTLSTNNVRSLRVLVPPIKAQERYQNFVHRHALFLERQSQGLKESEALFASLLDQAFRGELTSPHSPSRTPRQLSLL